MPRMLITGVSGMLGSNLACRFRDRYDILGLYCAHPVTLEGVRTRKADLLADDAIRRAVQEYSPDVVIHCASLTNVDFCEAHQEITRRVNVLGTRTVTESLAGSKAYLIYISSDSVYDGTKGNFAETDPVRPLNYYGQSKYEGELEVRKHPHSLVLRTNIFGWNIVNKHSLGEWILHDLAAGRTINGFRDAYFSSIYTLELTRVLARLLQLRLTGVYNCASRTSLSKYEFAVRLAEARDLDASLIQPISIEDFGFKAKRGNNLSLDVSRVRAALDVELPTIQESIEAFCRDLDAGVPGKILAAGPAPPKRAPKGPLTYSRQTIEDDDIAAVVETLKSEWITQGPKIEQFEQALCAYTGAKYAVAVSSGTAALHVACLAADIRPGDEVVVSPMTFAASANCVLYCGGRPVFADVERGSANINPQEVEKAVTDKTKAIIPVHYAGRPCDLEAIRQIAGPRGLVVIEDAAHALGAAYRGAKIGSCTYGDMAIFSFHPVKSITTAEGGAVLTNDRELYERLQMFRNHGITKDPSRLAQKGRQDAPPWYYQMQHLGFNYRITDIQAALGLSQLKKLDRFIARRRQIASRYGQALAGIERLELPGEDEGTQSAWHLYPIRLAEAPDVEAERRRMFDYLCRNGIRPQVHYIPVHLHPFYADRLGCRRGDCPNAESHYRRALSMPIYPSLSEQDVEKVIAAIKGYLDA